MSWSNHCFTKHHGTTIIYQICHYNQNPYLKFWYIKTIMTYLLCFKITPTISANSMFYFTIHNEKLLSCRFFVFFESLLSKTSMSSDLWIKNHLSSFTNHIFQSSFTLRSLRFVKSGNLGISSCLACFSFILLRAEELAIAKQLFLPISYLSTSTQKILLKFFSWVV